MASLGPVWQVFSGFGGLADGASYPSAVKTALDPLEIRSALDCACLCSLVLDVASRIPASTGGKNPRELESRMHELAWRLAT